MYALRLSTRLKTLPKYCFLYLFSARPVKHRHLACQARLACREHESFRIQLGALLDYSEDIGAGSTLGKTVIADKIKDRSRTSSQ
jgi:hypothetical protein